MILALTTLTAGLLGSLAGANVMAAITDPEWATPINTLLTLVLIGIAGHNGSRILRSERKIEAKVETATEKVEEARETATSAAEAAAAAAQASATAARIMKEFGGAYRHVDPPATRDDD